VKSLVPVLLAVSLSALALDVSNAAGSRTQSADGKAQMSGTFHLSEKEPTKHLSLRGKTGIVKVNNVGPAGLVVRNSKNNMTLAANSHASLTFEGDTDLSVSTSGESRETDGSFEVILSHE
jgi:hypothetical protein